MRLQKMLGLGADLAKGDRLHPRPLKAEVEATDAREKRQHP
jgi:hypothetical protein